MENSEATAVAHFTLRFVTECINFVRIRIISSGQCATETSRKVITSGVNDLATSLPSVTVT